MRFKTFYENITFIDKIKQKYNIDYFEDGNIGFSKKDNKWYGFSHRAIYGFGVGSICKIGDVNFIPKNKEDFIDNLKSEYNSKYYKNVNFNETNKYIKVDYEIHRKDGTIFKTNRLYKFPAKYGKGEWVALNIDDAKQMAKEFAKAVS